MIEIPCCAITAVLSCDYSGNEAIEASEKDLLKLPQVECPLKHTFAPGVYIRTIVMPAGTMIIGHEHLTRHANVVHRGSALVSINGEVSRLIAPCIFVSDAGVRKVLMIEEEMEFSTIHPTNETDLLELEKMLIRKSDSFAGYQRDIEALGESSNNLSSRGHPL